MATAALSILVNGGSTNRARAAAAAGAVPVLCSLAGNAAISGAPSQHPCHQVQRLSDHHMGMLVQEALQEIVTVCPPAPKVAAACARGLVRRLQQQQQQQQGQQATFASRGGPAHMLVAALSVLLCIGSASSKEAAAGAAADAGAVEALVRLGRTLGAAGSAGLGVLGALVLAAEPSLRQLLPEAIVAAGGVEAALAQLQNVGQQEDAQGLQEDLLGTAARLLILLTSIESACAQEFRRRVLDGGS
jgi:hypothetical protein